MLTGEIFDELDCNSPISGIPKVLNYIWLTRETGPIEILDSELCIQDPEREIKPDSEETYYNCGAIDFKKNYCYLLKNVKIVYDDWQITIWTNNKKLIPETIIEAGNIGIEVKEISEISSYPNLVKIITEFNPKNSYESGNIVDIAKYLALFHVGGASFDINFAHYNKIPENIVSSYSSLSLRSENFFFASEPHHPIMRTILDEVDIQIESRGESTYISNKDSMMSFLLTTVDNYIKTKKCAERNLVLFVRCRGISIRNPWLTLGEDGAENSWARV